MSTAGQLELMTDASDEEGSGEDPPSDDPPESGEADPAEEASPRRTDGARDVIGTALGALRAMIDPTDDTNAPDDSPDTGASD